MNVKLEYKTANWIANVINEIPEEGQDFAEWIKDGKILCRFLNILVFNSVPIDVSFDLKKDAKVSNEVRATCLIKHLEEFGIGKDDLFHPKDLTELRNIPRVCRCLEKLQV